MNIFILSDGKEIGPFSEETAQILIKQGTVGVTDLAWTSGMEDWAPLDKVLSLNRESAAPQQTIEAPEAPSSGAGVEDAPAEAKPEIEPATPKQKVFLRYLGIEVPEDLSREQASTLLSDAKENPACAEKIGKWSAERLRLHPELFTAEIHARKEDRANHFFEICQTEGAQYFTRITKAHCQVLVGFLDVKFPSWDSRMEDAATNYFFPAIAEKFPQLVERHWKDRFHYIQNSGTESARKATAGHVRKRPLTPLVAVLRGLVLGIAVLVVLYFGQKMAPRWIGRHPAEKAVSDLSSSPPPYGAASARSPKAAEPATATSPAPKKGDDKTTAEGQDAAPTSTPAPAKEPQGAAPGSDEASSSSPPAVKPSGGS